MLGLVLIASGAAQGHGPARVRIVDPVEVVGIPDPRDIFTILEKNVSAEIGMPPYVVPPDKLLVITAAGTDPGQAEVCRVLVDNKEVYRSTFQTARVEPVPQHLTISAGSELVLGNNNGNTQTAVVWCYLIDA